MMLGSYRIRACYCNRAYRDICNRRARNVRRLIVHEVNTQRRLLLQLRSCRNSDSKEARNIKRDNIRY